MNDGSTGPPQGSHQPRWAWWVIGIDLDTSPAPTVSGGSTDGADITFGAPSGTPELYVPDYAKNLVPWPAPDVVPTAAECAASVDANGSPYAAVKPGDRFCLRTGEGRTVYLSAKAAPIQGTGRLEVTVWDTPAA
ncbi:hypothetical protein ACWD0J_22525 [Streptomyces sp. NPDC003011]